MKMSWIQVCFCSFLKYGSFLSPPTSTDTERHVRSWKSDVRGCKLWTVTYLKVSPVKVSDFLPLVGKANLELQIDLAVTSKYFRPHSQQSHWITPDLIPRSNTSTCPQPVSCDSKGLSKTNPDKVRVQRETWQTQMRWICFAGSYSGG